MAEPTREKDPLRSFAFIENFDTMAHDLMEICEAPDITIGKIIKTFSEKQKTGNIFYYTMGQQSDSDVALIACYDTGYINNKDIGIYGFFERNKVTANWKGIGFTTLDAIISNCTDIFNCGDIKFKPFSSARVFFDELKAMAIPETWVYKTHRSRIPHPVLKSFIENTYYRLIHEQKNGATKIIRNDTHLLFNTGLLDKYFHDIYIIAELSESPESSVCYNPVMTTSLAKLKDFGGFNIAGKPINKKNMMPEKANFFKDISEVVFNNDIEIDTDFHQFKHIIEDGRHRFPEKYVNASSSELAGHVDKAISGAKLMALRNYKFIIPQYHPKKNKIQFLMPLYLDGRFNEAAPDLALVLDLDAVSEVYVPETVLPLDAAYQNARLIAKPDNQWLDPEDRPKK